MKNLIVVVLDHFDSFTHNLVHVLGDIDIESVVLRTDSTLSDIKKYTPSHLILSPGPGHPRDVNLFLQAIEEFKGHIPILGVCLGHQAIAYQAKVSVIKNFRIMHGMQSAIQHTGESIFTGLPSTFEVQRYHSLVVDEKSATKNGFEILARTEENEVMSIRKIDIPNLIGVQFHPESYFGNTEVGKQLLKNFISL